MDNSNDPANIIHKSYSAGLSVGPFYIEGSVENGNGGNLEPSLNAGANLSLSTPTTIYYEAGKGREISYGKGGLESSTNYFNSFGAALGIKKLGLYIEKTSYVNKDDVDKYNERVEDYKEIKEHPIYKSNRAIREQINHDYNDCIYPHDYNAEFFIPKKTK